MAIFGPRHISVFTLFNLPYRYATDNGINKVVSVETGEPGPKRTVRITTFIIQRFISSATQWFVQPVGGKENVYTITVGIAPPELGTPGFRKEIELGPDDVINSPLHGEWLLVPVGEEHDVYE